jgi:hypothetical protein
MRLIVGRLFHLRKTDEIKPPLPLARNRWLKAGFSDSSVFSQAFRLRLCMIQGSPDGTVPEVCFQPYHFVFSLSHQINCTAVFCPEFSAFS